MKRTSSGFILYEVLLYLLISTVCFTTIYNELNFTKNLVKQDTIRLVNWHSSMNRLDNLFDEAKIISCDYKAVKLIPRVDYEEKQKEFTVDFYTSKKKVTMLRARGASSGHMPIFVNVKSGRFKYNNQILTIRIVDLNKKVFEYVHKNSKA